MKTVGTILSAVFALMPWIAEPLFSQQNAPASGEKKITITKRSFDADGSETTEIIVKRGKAAENFDVDKYVSENRGDKVRLDVKVEEGGENDKKVIVRRSPGNDGDSDYDYDYDQTTPSCGDKKAFLGVEEDSDEDAGRPGLVVEIVRGSAADKAGLRDNDMILKLNDQKTDRWSDLTRFMNNAKPGDVVNITYMRAGKRNTTEAVLGEQKSWDWKNWNIGNLNLDDADINIREKEACLGVYTEESTEDEKRGARITNFTTESAAREVQMQTGDVITAVNSRRVQNHDDLWNEIAKYKAGDKVSVEYLRDNLPVTVEATLKACGDNSGRVQVWDTDQDGDNRSRRFFIWNWSGDERRQLRERRIITIRRGADGDSPKVNAAPENQTTPQDRSLKLESFRVYPNPTQGQATIEFKSEPVATIVSLFDMGGRQIFREELNAFSGDYNQQFDLTEYAKGTVIVYILQGEKVFTDQIVVN